MCVFVSVIVSVSVCVFVLTCDLECFSWVAVVWGCVGSTAGAIRLECCIGSAYMAPRLAEPYYGPLLRDFRGLGAAAAAFGWRGRCGRGGIFGILKAKQNMTTQTQTLRI